jgi:hypothetical protein
MTSELRRRDVLRAGAVMMGGVLLAPRVLRAEEPYRLPEITKQAMGTSPLVYISPLHPSGKESSCHGEVWFFDDGGDVVIATGKDAWKARAVGKGWDGARIWVGDFGPVSRASDKFRTAPEFKARASIDTDPEVFERLMASFAKKYADGWDKWEPRFRKGYGDGSRVVIRYTPIAS